jgi:hypothetical protein
MIQANQIAEDATIDIRSSFLRSSSLKQIRQLSLQQIEILLESIPEAYASPLNANERSKAVI